MSQSTLPNCRENFVQIDSSNGVDGYTHTSFLPPDADWVKISEQIENDPGTVLRGGGGQGITSMCVIEGREVFCKRYVPSRLRRRFRDMLGFLRSVDEWKSNTEAAKKEIQSATVLASFSVKRSRFAIYHYFITEPVKGVDFLTRLEKSDESGESKVSILEELGSYIAWLHHSGFYHAHLNGAHIFRTDWNDFYLIDLEHAFIQKPLPEKYTQNNLKQIRKSLKKYITSEEMTAFFESYRSWAPTSQSQHSSGAVRKWQPAGR